MQLLKIFKNYVVAGFKSYEVADLRWRIQKF